MTIIIVENCDDLQLAKRNKDEFEETSTYILFSKDSD